jgi:hypothetical protein
MLKPWSTANGVILGGGALLKEVSLWQLSPWDYILPWPLAPPPPL